MYVISSENSFICTNVRRQSIFRACNAFVILQILHQCANRVKMYIIFVYEICFDSEFLSKKNSLIDVVRINDVFHAFDVK